VGRILFTLRCSGPTQRAFRPINSRRNPFPHLFRCRVGPARQLPFLPPFFPPYLFGPRRSAEPGAQRRRSNHASPRGVARGRAARLARTPRSGACTRTQKRPRERDLTPLPLFHQASEAGRASPRAPPGPGRRRARGIVGLSPSGPRGAVSKGEEAGEVWRQG
jgi:hypothetical protein